MFCRSEEEIRAIVRDEIRRELDKHLNNRVKRIYNEENEIIGTEFTFFENAEHIVSYITKSTDNDYEFFVSHSRAHSNIETIRSDGSNAESIDKEYNAEYVFRKGCPVPAGYKLTSSGFAVPE